MEYIKNFLKRILPPPVRTFLREVEGLRRLMEKQTRLLEERQRDVLGAVACLAEEQTVQMDTLHRENEVLAKRLEEQTVQMEALRRENEVLAKRLEEQTVQLERMERDTQTALQKAVEERKQLATAVEKARLQSVEGTRYASEAVWAAIFNNAISGSTWLKNTTFSPGRWAVGYPALYVMYRILNEARPKRILELGLGQSTRMIAQYAAAYEDVEHIVVEHDAEWIAFFKNDFALSERTKILQLDRELVPYKDAEAVRVFKGFQEAFTGQKFDFIFVDAPLASDMKQYARIDILSILPGCFSDSFAVMLDDSGRRGEQNTLMEIKSLFEESGVDFCQGRYSGKKDCAVIASPNQRFLTTL